MQGKMWEKLFGREGGGSVAPRVQIERGEGGRLVSVTEIYNPEYATMGFECFRNVRGSEYVSGQTDFCVKLPDGLAIITHIQYWGSFIPAKYIE